MRIRRHAPIVLSVLLVAAVFVRADDPPVPPAPARGNQWSLAILPDSQAYNQTYDLGRWKGRGYQYKDRWPKQIDWIVANRKVYNIRFAVSVGDHVQNFGFDPAAEPEERQKAARQWLAWYRANGSALRWSEERHRFEPAGAAATGPRPGAAEAGRSD